MKRAVIIGAGMSGMALAFRLKRDHGVAVTLLEADCRVGGKARTVSEEGFTCEEATNGWLDKERAMRDLVADLGLETRVQPSDEAAERRFIYRQGKLCELKMHPLKFMMSDALPLGVRCRIALEPFVGKRIDQSDETLADFARRRLGRGARDLLIGPMAFGVYAGDPEKMSLKSCFPKVHALEVNHGGLIKGMIALKTEKKRAGENPSEVQAGPSGRLTSLKGGMSDLTEALEKTLESSLRLATPVSVIRQKGDGRFEVCVEGAENIVADAVISAAPAHAAATYLESLDRAAAEAFGEIPYPSLFVVCLGYPEEAVRQSLDGFGFLVPRRQGKTILGTLFTSSIFPGRAPKGHVLIRTMLGGMLEPQVATLSNQEAVGLVTEELRDILDIEPNTTPAFTRAFRHDRAIPQYHVGHSALKEEILAAEKRHPGFFATGNAIKGIGVIDCVRESVPLAERVAGYLNRS